MVADQLVLPYLWRRYLSLLRALVGGSCLWFILAGGVPERTVLVGILAILTCYSAISVFWRWPERIDKLDIFNLILDVATFLVCVAVSGKDGFWVSSFAVFYLFLATATMHDWRDVLLITVLTLAFVNSVRPPFTDRLQPILLLLGMFGMIMALQKQSLLTRLSAGSRQAVYYRSEAERARESERERLAADFHDGPLQSFISVQMRLEVLRRMMEKSPVAGVEELKQLQEMTAKQVTEVRTFVRSMRPIEVEGMGLAAALRSLTGLFQKDSGIATSFHAASTARHDDLDANTDLLQIVREGLNNIRKHSGASRAAVRLDRENRHLILQIEDDGSGFPFAGSYTLEEMEMLGLGPASIKRRVKSLNGEITVDSRPGRGATLRVRVPL